MATLNKKIRNTIEVIDGAGIVPTGEIMATKEEVERMALNNLIIIPFAGRTYVIQTNGEKQIMSEGEYSTTPEHIRHMVLGRIKYAN